MERHEGLRKSEIANLLMVDSGCKKPKATLSGLKNPYLFACQKWNHDAAEIVVRGGNASQPIRNHAPGTEAQQSLYQSEVSSPSL